MKTVAIVAAHFVPSNLAAVHRARLWSLHLREFGWEPVIITTHWEYYEETPEHELCELLPPDLEVIRTKALPTRPIRLIGDVGLRAFPWHLAAIDELCGRRKVDFVHITIPSNYSACLGRIVHRRIGIPYGIDYIDPWVHSFPGSDVPFTKAWMSAKLASFMEPIAVRGAKLITGINRQYYEGVLERNPKLRTQAVLAEMPYGGSEKDHDYARHHPGTLRLFAGHAGKFNIIYAGAMLPQAYVVLHRLLDAIVLLRSEEPALAARFHLHFVGTGKSPDDPFGYNVRPHIESRALGDCVSEYPERLPYIDVLRHLHAARGVLVLGSTEPHYSPSKVFQSAMSRRPIFAMLHERSTALATLERVTRSTIVTFGDSALPDANDVKTAMRAFLARADGPELMLDGAALASLSARASAETLAHALDQVVERQQTPRGGICARSGVQGPH